VKDVLEMTEYVFGANILENLTTGMYQDSRVIYREYIQNACDQIDKAQREGLLKKNEGHIDIQLDEVERVITITDNATGIPAALFREMLGNIAASDKQIGEAKGFRGIGRLCGLAYCRQLVFSSKAKGESVISILRCDAEKMRKLIDQNNRGYKVSAQELLNEMYEFPEPIPVSKKDSDKHWFKVELKDVNTENRDLLAFLNVKEYLSFVAPVPYESKFIFRNKVYEHAESIGQHIDEYKITLNGEYIHKKYGTKFKTSKGEDEIFDVVFKDFYDDNSNLIAWSWFGLSRLKAVIKKECAMRGLRLRKENIQIGDEDALKKLFREDRGQHYFVGEVFAVSNSLIPNSQRDYFNENAERNIFESRIRNFFNEELTRLYRDSSDINAAYGKISNYEKKSSEFEQKKQEGMFIDKAHEEEEARAVEKAKQEAEKARENIEKQKKKVEDDPDNPTRKIITRIEEERKRTEKQSKEKQKEQNNQQKKKKKDPEEQTVSHRTDKLSSLQKKDRKLLSKVFSIIYSTTDEKTAELIISRIEDEFK